jgi:REP element-mobilizing transposase RayT
MKFDPQKHHRRSIRLKGYDYTQPGAYFVTIVTQYRECRFGEIVGEEMRLNEAGQMIQTVWIELSTRFLNIQLDEFVVMPNHFHGILFIVEPAQKMVNNPTGAVGMGRAARAGTRPAPTDDTGSETVGATLVVAPDMVAPDMVAPDVVAPGVITPDVVVPDMVAPDVVAPGVVAPDVVAPDMVAPGVAAPRGSKPTLGNMVGVFKSITTGKYIQGVRQSGWPPFDRYLWQRNYYEHIIRDEAELTSICQYIHDNPVKWEIDQENPVIAQLGKISPHD